MLAPLFGPGGSGIFVSDIFREIDEELRRDNLLKALVALRPLCDPSRGARDPGCGRKSWAGASTSWSQRQRPSRSATVAALELGPPGQGCPRRPSSSPRSVRRVAGYSILASFEAAELSGPKSGDRQGAIAAYDRIAQSISLDKPFRRPRPCLLFGDARHARGRPQGGGGAAAAAHRSGQIRGARPPSSSTAIRAPQGGRPQAARLELYKKIADDAEAPQGLRARPPAEMAAGTRLLTASSGSRNVRSRNASSCRCRARSPSLVFGAPRLRPRRMRTGSTRRRPRSRASASRS